MHFDSAQYKQKGFVQFVVLGIVVLAVVAAGAFYLGKQTSSKPVQSQKQMGTPKAVPSPTQPAFSNEEEIPLDIFDNFAFGKFVASPNSSDHTQTIYLVRDEYNSSSRQTITKKTKIIGPVSAESFFTDIKLSPNGRQFTFKLSGPGDGHSYNLASVDGTSTRELELPSNYIFNSSRIVGWVNDSTLLIEETTKSSVEAPEQVSYWTININNLKDKKIISF